MVSFSRLLYAHVLVELILWICGWQQGIAWLAIFNIAWSQFLIHFWPLAHFRQDTSTTWTVMLSTNGYSGPNTIHARVQGDPQRDRASSLRWQDMVAKVKDARAASDRPWHLFWSVARFWFHCALMTSNPLVAPLDCVLVSLAQFGLWWR